MDKIDNAIMNYDDNYRKNSREIIFSLLEKIKKLQTNNNILIKVLDDIRLMAIPDSLIFDTVEETLKKIKG